jgi:hypothetical protein
MQDKRNERHQAVHDFQTDDTCKARSDSLFFRTFVGLLKDVRVHLLCTRLTAYVQLACRLLRVLVTNPGSTRLRSSC